MQGNNDNIWLGNLSRIRNKMKIQGGVSKRDGTGKTMETLSMKRLVIPGVWGQKRSEQEEHRGFLRQ